MTWLTLTLGIALGAGGYHAVRWWLSRRRQARVIRRMLDTWREHEANRRRLEAEFAALTGRRVIYEDHAAIAELEQWQVVPGPRGVN